MFLFFSSRYDFEAIWLYKQINADKKIDAEIFFVEDLYDCKDWQLRLSDRRCYAAVTLPNGRIADTERVSLFLNRVNFITHPFWSKKDTVERQYFEQEWNAFMLGWLQAFEPVLLNKPLPGYLAGYMPLPLRWQILATKAGFKISPVHFSSDNIYPNRLHEAAITKSAKSILVFNYKVFAPISLAALSEKCIDLAKSVDCKLLEIWVDQNDQGEYYFISANSLTNFSNHSSTFLRSLKIMALNASKQPALQATEEVLV